MENTDDIQDLKFEYTPITNNINDKTLINSLQSIQLNTDSNIVSSNETEMIKIDETQ